MPSGRDREHSALPHSPPTQLPVNYHFHLPEPSGLYISCRALGHTRVAARKECGERKSHLGKEKSIRKRKKNARRM